MAGFTKLHFSLSDDEAPGDRSRSPPPLREAANRLAAIASAFGKVGL